MSKAKPDHTFRALHDREVPWDEAAARKILALPEGRELFGCVTVGYPVRTFKKIPARNAADVTWK